MYLDWGLEIDQGTLDLQHGSRGHFSSKLAIVHGVRSGIIKVKTTLINQPQEMATHNIESPAPFDFRNPEQWPKWIRRFERYRISTELSKKDAVLQINDMIYCMGDEADDIVKSFAFVATDEKK